MASEEDTLESALMKIAPFVGAELEAVTISGGDVPPIYWSNAIDLSRWKTPVEGTAYTAVSVGCPHCDATIEFRFEGEISGTGGEEKACETCGKSVEIQWSEVSDGE